MYYFLCTCLILLSLASNGVAKEGDILVEPQCKEIDTVIAGKKQICVSMEEAKSCEILMSATLDGSQVFRQILDMNVSPRVCGKTQGTPVTCDVCVELADIPSSDQYCAKVHTTCGAFNLNPVNAGCFPKSKLDPIQNCRAGNCPNKCSGKGTCVDGICKCFDGYFGSNCSSTVPSFESCQRFSNLTSPVCVKVKFDDDDCKFDLGLYLRGANAEIKIADTEYPISEFRYVLQDSTNCYSAGGCDMCLEWRDLILNSTAASACGDLTFACAGFPQKVRRPLSCFADNSILPKCWGTCPNLCSGRGECINGVCKCVAGWDKEDCSVKTSCPNSCSGHGKCSENKCQCDKNYSGPDCATYIAPGEDDDDDESQHSTTHKKPSMSAAGVVFVIIASLSGIGIAGTVIWYVIKRRSNPTPQFSPLDLLENDESMTELDEE